MNKTKFSSPIKKALKEAGRAINRAPRPEVYSEVVAEKIKGLVLSGVDERHMCLYFDISLENLKRLYGELMIKYHIEANVDVANALLVNAKETGTKHSVDAQKFWMKARAGWRERDEDVKRSDGIEIHIHV